MMNAQDVTSCLGPHRTELLQRFRVRELGLFGSVARNEARPGSDADFLVVFDGPATFRAYMGLKAYLEKILGVPVDLVTHQALRPQLRGKIERELVSVA